MQSVISPLLTQKNKFQSQTTNNHSEIVPIRQITLHNLEKTLLCMRSIYPQFNDLILKSSES